MSDSYNNAAMPGLTWITPCDDSNVQQCVAVAAAGNGMIAVADTKDPAATPLTFTKGEIRALLAAGANGDFAELLA